MEVNKGEILRSKEISLGVKTEYSKRKKVFLNKSIKNVPYI